MTSMLQRFASWSFHPTKKRVFSFSDGSKDDTALLGIKGARLCELARLKLPVPPGFIISTETSADFHNSLESVAREARFAFADNLPDQLVDAYRAHVYDLETQTGKNFGKCSGKPSGSAVETKTLPLLLAVRCDAPYKSNNASQTILNLGINDEIVQGISSCVNEQFALDCYRRFIQMFATTVYGIPKSKFDEISANILARSGKMNESELDSINMKALIAAYKEVAIIPDDPWRQLELAILSYYRWWFSDRSMAERSLSNGSKDKGVAVIVQSMVYGNMNNRSGTGICATRCPSTGSKLMIGEYLMCSEGEELKYSRRSSVSLEEMKSHKPEVYEKLVHDANLLEVHFKDMQADVRICTELVQEGILSAREGLLKVDANSMLAYTQCFLDTNIATDLGPLRIGVGMPACPGAGSGYLTFNLSDAITWSKQGKPVVLCRKDLSEHDFDAVQACTAVLTLFGGNQSQSAIIARHLSKPAVVGAGYCSCGTSCRCGPTCVCLSRDTTGDVQECACCMSLDVKYNSLRCCDGNQIFSGELVTVDGTTGNVYRTMLPTTRDTSDQYFRLLITWAERYKRLGILSNAMDLDNALLSTELGAEGVGLWSSDKFYLSDENINLLRQLIFSPSQELIYSISRDCQLRTQAFFLGLFRNLPQHSICIKVFDPTLIDLLPTFGSGSFSSDLLAIARSLHLDYDWCNKRVSEICDQNPPSSIIGCRLLQSLPEFADAQIEGILGAACLANSDGAAVDLQILLPWLLSDEDVANFVKRIKVIAEKKCLELNCNIKFKIGCMLEAPRLCLRVNDIIERVPIDFILMDTNLLTSMMFGYGSTKSPKYLTQFGYPTAKRNPFLSIDDKGVGLLLKNAVHRCRHSNPKVKIGIQGIHTSDPFSVNFFNSLEVDYLCVDGSHIATAIVAAAQSHIRHSSNTQQIDTKSIWPIVPGFFPGRIF